MGEKLEQLKQHLYPYYDLQHANAVLEWDQQVNMPPGGTDARAEQMATLTALSHDIFTSPETGRLLEAAETEVAGMDFGSDEASMVRLLRRQYDKQTKLPTELVAEISRVTAQAFTAWREARQGNAYPVFQPYLQKIVELNQKVADILGYEEHPYDALLDEFEPGMTTSQTAALFDTLKVGLVPLIREITERGKPVDDAFFSEEYATAKQWDFTLAILREIGYDFQRGRQDLAPHPFTTNFSCNDVRLTTRFLVNRPQSAIFSSVHEGGHALYELNIPERFERTALSGGATYGIHESQSRMWENIVGRSRSFWKHYLPIFRAFFPEALEGITLEQFYRAINKVQPDFIRVEADEVTYNLHIFVRFELEQALLTGKLAVADVPEAWNAKYREYLGITPKTDSEGCLQDMHWANGIFGYFPTYTIGNVISAQLYRRAKAEIPGLEDGFAEGQFAPLLGWMRDHVHAHGAKFTAKELLERELGEELSAQPLLTYLRERYTEVYGL